MASRNAAPSTAAIGSGPIASKAPAMASSGRWSIQLMVCRRSLRGARGTARMGDVVRVEPRGVGPAVLVVIRHAFVGQRHHAIQRPGAARVPQRLDADVLVVAGVVHLVELVAAAELG